MNQTSLAELFGELKEEEPKTSLMVFRVSGKRYAIPANLVRRMGRLGGGAWLRGVVLSGSDVFPLRDFKKALGIQGEAGSVYLVVDGGEKPTAWAVDGVEGVQEVELSRIRSLSRFGRPFGGPVEKMVSRPKDSLPGQHAPIYMVNATVLDLEKKLSKN